jgi:CRP/FNR family cyclic AMP-dependent transcriptional regulator
MAGSESREMAAKLETYPTFAQCSHDDLLALAKAGSRFAVPAGWSFVQEGIPSDACYVIMDGTANVYHERSPIATLGEGDVVGEMTLLAGGQRRATVSSVTPVRGLRIENDVLTDLLSKRPKLREALDAVYRAHQSGD